MRCPVCLEEIPRHSRFCDRCGVRIASGARLRRTGASAGEELRRRLHVILRSTLKLEGDPVAVKLLRDEPPPAYFHEPEGPSPHCHMIWRAHKGESLHSPSSKHSCMIGALCLGLASHRNGLKGAFMDSVGYGSRNKFRSGELLERYLREVPTVPMGVKGVLYAPLGRAPSDPDVVIVLGDSMKATLLLEAYHYVYGRRLQVSLGAYFPLCAESVAGPLTTGSMSLTPAGGCAIRGDEGFRNLVSTAFPYYMARRIVEALESLNIRG